MDSESILNNRNKSFQTSFDEDLFKFRRDSSQVELRRKLRSDNIFCKRNLKTFEIDWISTESFPSQEISLSELDDYIESLKHSNKKINLTGVYKLRKILSNPRENPISKVIDSGAVVYLINFLYRDECPQLQYESAWALTNICTGSSSHIEEIINKGCLKALIHMLGSNINELKEQSLWALGNIASDSDKIRNFLLTSTGVLGPLISNVMDSTDSAVIKKGAWVISNICRTKPIPAVSFLSLMFPVLEKALMMHDVIQEVAEDVLWAFEASTQNSETMIEKLLSLDIAGIVIKFALGGKFEYVLPAVKIVGNIIGGTDAQADKIIKFGAGRVLLAAINVKFAPIRKEAVWAVSNLCAGTTQQLQLVMKSGLMRILIAISQNECLEIQTDIIWAYCNIISNDSDFYEPLLEENILRSLVFFLKISDAKIVIVAIICIDKLFSFLFTERSLLERYYKDFLDLGGVDTLVKLQSHKNPKIYDKARSVLERYFDSESEYQSLIENIKELSGYIL